MSVPQAQTLAFWQRPLAADQARSATEPARMGAGHRTAAAGHTPASRSRLWPWEHRMVPYRPASIRVAVEPYRYWFGVPRRAAPSRLLSTAHGERMPLAAAFAW